MKIHKNISQTQLSIARYSGGMKINGEEFIYDPKHDTLILKKDLKEYITSLKKEKPKEEPTKNNQQNLF